MYLIAIALTAQLGAPLRLAPPVLAFPEPGMDDSAAYAGYQTRFFRDAAGNTVQIYLDAREGRAVHLLANAENESVGFSVRGPGGGAATLRWGEPRAGTARAGRWRSLEHHLVGDAGELHLGRFLLGTMRAERDFQYWKGHREAFLAAPFRLAELERLVAALGELDPVSRRRHLAYLGAADVETLRARLTPTVTSQRAGRLWIARVVQPSLDGRDTLQLELRADARFVDATRTGDSISLRARTGTRVPFTVRIATTGRVLTPLPRRAIFNREFLAFLAAARAADGVRANGRDSASVRARWLERQVRGFELLASREKLMAGLPAYATYFGRDMLVTALTMRAVWRDEMSEFVIASALGKLSPRGEVSHEEAVGGQAVREAVSEYVSVLQEFHRAAREGRGAAADSLLAHAGSVLRDSRQVRENYHMIDDEFQLPVLAAHWLDDPRVSAARKRAFLLEVSNGEPRLHLLLRELALVTRLTAAYAADPVAGNLVAFPPRDSGWSSSSWRDSGAGYAGGRYAMDVNAVWVPHALESTGRILAALRTLGIPAASLAGSVRGVRDSPLERYARDSSALRLALDRWRGATRHFVVRLGPDEVRSRVAARLASMSSDERAHWAEMGRQARDGDSLTFLAVALDADGRPIGVANSDPSTQIFLGDLPGPVAPSDASPASALMRDVRLFVRPYPVGLFVDRVGPVVANDAYAPEAVWRAFERDRYHGPRVVWGREVNLFLLGVANRLAANDPAARAHAPELRSAMDRVMTAVRASGFRSELWSYELRGGQLVPVRYGTGSDVQLWSTSDLAVQFALHRLGR